MQATNIDTAAMARDMAAGEVPIERSQRNWTIMNADPAFQALRDRVLALVRGIEA